MGKRITGGWYPYMNPKQEISLTVAKIQQKATITFWQGSKHTT
jgi:hypothetical protein